MSFLIVSTKDKILVSQIKTKIVLFLKSSEKATFKDIKDDVNISTDRGLTER